MSKTHPKISVLIPVYNTEKYLDRCLSSVMRQTLSEIEVIIIDDGSTDKSLEICKRYATKDSRFRVYHTSNQGISATREYALSLSNGTYIQFVDSDDWIEPDMLEVMYSEAKCKNTDIIGCNFVEHWPNRDIVYNTYYEDYDTFIRAIISSHWGVLWNKLFRRDIFINGNVHFPKNINGGEDYIVCVKLMLKTTSVSCVNKELYHYNRMNVNSTINTMNINKVKEQINATDIVIALLQDQNKLDTYENEILRRKFSSKMPLAIHCFVEWTKIYPESNRLVKKMKWGKLKLYIIIRLFINKILDYATRK